MAGDLEDFLRRAASRRQQKAVEQQQAPQQRRRQPEYSDSRSERISREPDEPVLTAEIIAEDPKSHAARLHRAEEAKRTAVKAKKQAKKSAEQARQRAARKRPVALGSTGKPAQDLVNLLKQPGGIQQAILLREILDRPEHRW